MSKPKAKPTTSDRILALLEDGPMTRKDIIALLGLTESEAKSVLHHLHLQGRVQCLDKSHQRPFWALPGHDCVKAYIAEIRKSPIGRYLTGAPV
jgi:hypothetical protein